MSHLADLVDCHDRRDFVERRLSLADLLPFIQPSILRLASGG
jgi:hypothetical protein